MKTVVRIPQATTQYVVVPFEAVLRSSSLGVSVGMVLTANTLAMDVKESMDEEDVCLVRRFALM